MSINENTATNATQNLWKKQQISELIPSWQPTPIPKIVNEQKGPITKYVHKRITANKKNMSYYQKLKAMISHNEKQEHQWGYKNKYAHKYYNGSNTNIDSNRIGNTANTTNNNIQSQLNNSSIINTQSLKTKQKLPLSVLQSQQNSKKVRNIVDQQQMHNKIKQYLQQFEHQQKRNNDININNQYNAQLEKQNQILYREILRNARIAQSRQENISHTSQKKRNLKDMRMDIEQPSLSKSRGKGKAQNNIDSAYKARSSIYTQSMQQDKMVQKIKKTEMLVEKLSKLSSSLQKSQNTSSLIKHCRVQSEISLSNRAKQLMPLKQLPRKNQKPNSKSTHKHSAQAQLNTMSPGIAKPTKTNNINKTIEDTLGRNIHKQQYGRRNDSSGKMVDAYAHLREGFGDRGSQDGDLVVNINDVIDQMDSKQILNKQTTNQAQRDKKYQINHRRTHNISTKNNYNQTKKINDNTASNRLKISQRKITDKQLLQQIKAQLQIGRTRVLSNNVDYKNAVKPLSTLNPPQNPVNTNINISTNSNMKNRSKYEVINYNKYTPYPPPFTSSIDVQANQQICCKWGKMELLEMLGSGANAIVREGVCQGSKYAIKIYEKYKLLQPRKKKRVYTQIQLLQSLPIHPNIITIHQAFQDKRQIHVIFQHLTRSITLHQYFRNTMLNLPVKQVRRIFGKLVRGVCHLHEFGIAHRDIKPENVLISFDGDVVESDELSDLAQANRFGEQDVVVKLIDFGFATTANYADVSCGTPNFMAPELLDKPVKYNTFPVDIWALGVTLFYLLQSRYPFKGYDQKDLYKNIKSGKFQFKKITQPQIRQIITQMLIINPEQRIRARQLVKKQWVFNCV